MTRTHLDLFSGIGGFALACRWAGVQTVGFAEIDDYASRVLAKNFPGVPNYGDVRDVPGDVSAWLVTGGFPCQPFSVAGQQRGADDDRYLWPEMAAIIERVRPAWVLAENVPGIISMALDDVLLDLENLGYTTWPIVVPAVAVNAPHRRDRVWIVAHTDGDRREWWTRESQRKPERGGTANVSATREALVDADSNHSLGRGGDVQVGRQRLAGEASPDGYTTGAQWEAEPGVGRVAHGVSHRVDRLRGLGNAIVPQVAYRLINWMVEAESV